MNWRDIGERAAWTFVQAFVGTLSAAQIGNAAANGDMETLQALALSGVSAGVASLVSLVKTAAQERSPRLETRPSERYHAGRWDK